MAHAALFSMRTALFPFILCLALLLGSCHSPPPIPAEQVSLRIDHCPTAEEIASWQQQGELYELMIWIDGEGFATDGPPPKRFGDEELGQLASIPQLRRLTLGGWDMAYSDMGLQALAAMEHLEHLSLCQAPGVSDVGMKIVAQLPNLRSLDLTYTAVTDVGLEHLLDAPKLEEVSYGWAQASVRHLESFRQRHPEITWFDATKL